MSNELLFFITILVSFSGVILAYRFFGKAGIFGWVGFATLLANIEVIKCVDMFGMSVTLGNVLYGSTFLATDILNEIYGGKTSRKAVRMGFYMLIVFIPLSQTSLLYTPNEADFANDAIQTIYHFSPRICAASLITYFISNTLNSYLYNWLGRFTHRIWIKNNCSTLICQALDTVLFTILGFLGIFEWNIILELILTTYAIKFIVAICDTPFIYIANHMAKSKTTDNL